MIAYLQGTIVTISHRQLRHFLWLEVAGVGYELQILPRWAKQLEPQASQHLSGSPSLVSQSLQVFTYFYTRDDQWYLLGFATSQERELLRELIAVYGVGVQIALGLLDGLLVQELVETIVLGDTRRLSKVPGIGKKTADRLVLELQHKLSAWLPEASLKATSLPKLPVQDEVELTLGALGYGEEEILAAVRSVAQKEHPPHLDDVEAWIRESIAWLARD